MNREEYEALSDEEKRWCDRWRDYWEGQYAKVIQAMAQENVRLIEQDPVRMARINAEYTTVLDTDRLAHIAMLHTTALDYANLRSLEERANASCSVCGAPAGATA